MKTCTIQWIDSDGKPTPDNNEAVMVAFCHEPKWSLPAGGPGNKIIGYTEKIFESFPICAEHYAQVELSMRYEYGGAWTFGRIDP